MKRILLAFCLIVLLAAALPASADTTVTLTGNYSGLPTYAGAYVGPIPTTLDIYSPTPSPIPGGMTCLDVANTSYFGTTWGVNISTLQPLNMTNAKFGSDGAAILKYEEAAWLLGQIPSNFSQVGEIQFAIWNIFNQDGVDAHFGTAGRDITEENKWMELAAEINPSHYNFSSVLIY